MSSIVRRETVRALRSLSSLQPIMSLASSVAEIETIGGHEAAKFLELLRMRTLVMRRLIPAGGRNAAVRDCIAALAPTTERIAHMHRVLDQNLNLLQGIGDHEKVRIYAGKGVVARKMYDDENLRDLSDVDVFVRTCADAITLVRTLRDRHGYMYAEHELPWFKYDRERTNLLYGQFLLHPPVEKPQLLPIDIHFGDYSVRHTERLGLAATLTAAEPGLHSISFEENLACVVNNAAGDFFVTAKDTNDLLMALTMPGFDISRLVRLLAGAGLMDMLSSICDVLRQSAALSPAQEARLAELPTTPRHEPLPPDCLDWEARCLATVVHTFRAHQRVGTAHALRLALNAYDYYRSPLALTITPQPDLPVSPRDFNSWTCIRLVPVDLALRLNGQATSTLGAEATTERPDQPESIAQVADHACSDGADSGRYIGESRDIEWCDSRYGPYVRIAGEVFLATVSYQLSPALIGVAAALQRGTRC